MRDISERFVRSGHSVTVLTTTAIDHDALYSRDLRHRYVEDETRNGVRVKRCALEFGEKAGRFSSPSFNSRALARFVDRLEPGQFDVVNVSCFPFANLVVEAHRASARLDCPLLLTPFLHTHSLLAGHYQTQELRELVHRADKIICQTGHEAEFLTGRWEVAKRIPEVIGVGIATDAREWRREPHTTDEVVIPNEPMVLFLGTNDALKGTKALLEVSPRFHKDEAQFVIAGSPTMQFSRYLQTHRELPGHVRILGPVGDEARHELLRTMTCLAVPSVAESFGLVYLESWLHRKPVIAARCGPTEQLIDHGGDGLLVEFSDVDQLEAAVRTYVDSPELCSEHGQAGFPKAWEYRWPKLFNRLEEVYASAVGGK